MSVQDEVRELRAMQGVAVTAEEMASVDRQLAMLIDEQTLLLTRRWRQDNPDQVPQFADLLNIQRWAAMTADELLTAQYREELLMTVGESPETEQEQTPPDARPLSQRWVEDLEFVQGSTASLDLAERLWSHQPPLWVAVAASLIEVWTAEDQQLPESVDDERARQVERLVDARVAAEIELRQSMTTLS